MRRAIDSLAIAPDAVHFLGHGTTIATNMLIERKGSHDRSAYHGGLPRHPRDRAPGHDHTSTTTRAASRRPWCRASTATRCGNGSTRRAGFSFPSMKRRSTRLWRRLRPEGIEAVAICFLHSYLNPDHEARTGAAVARDGSPVLFSAHRARCCPSFANSNACRRQSRTPTSGPGCHATSKRWWAACGHSGSPSRRIPFIPTAA